EASRARRGGNVVDLSGIRPLDPRRAGEMGLRDPRGEDQARMSSTAQREAARVSDAKSAARVVAAFVDRARAAQRVADRYDQARVDELVTAAGWAIVNP